MTPKEHWDLVQNFFVLFAFVIFVVMVVLTRGFVGIFAMVLATYVLMHIIGATADPKPPIRPRS